MQKIQINPSFGDMAEFISSIPDTFQSSGSTIFTGRNTIKSLVSPADGKELIVKHFGYLNPLRRIAYTFFSRSKARRAYENGLRFIEKGFDSPTPVAYIEVYNGRLLSDCYFISLKARGMQLFEPLFEATEFDRVLADRVATLMADLHNCGAVHGDPNLKNILYDSATGRLELIDTNRSYFAKKISRRQALRNLMRVSHRRDLLDYIARRYASLRGYDPDRTSARIFALLKSFERNRAIRHKIKRLFQGK